MSQPIVFDVTETVIPYKIGGVDYNLHEASGDVAVRWRNAIVEATKFGPEGNVSGVRGIADTEPLLVSMCLKRVTETGEVAVPIGTIRAWKNKIQKALFNKVKEISELNEVPLTVEGLEKEIAALQKQLAKLKEGEEEEAKND